ncbi:hypothetical protein ACSBR2_030004 [Camellia fascicularis]
MREDEGDETTKKKAKKSYPMPWVEVEDEGDLWVEVEDEGRSRRRGSKLGRSRLYVAQLMRLGQKNLFTGTLPTSLSNASELEDIFFGANDFSGTMPRDIRKLLGLRRIVVYQNQLQDDLTFISSLTNCTSLKAIVAHRNKFTEVPSSIGNLTSLITLNLGENNIHGSIPPTLGNCHSLLELDLYKNNFNGSIPLEIMSLSSISTSLTLDHNALTGFLPSEIGSLKNLANMDVSYNKLSGPIPNTLSNCLSLEWLHLEANSFEGEIPQSLRLIRGLRVLDLSHNNLSGLIPSYLGELQLDMLNLSFNMLHGQVPIQGVFQNSSAISIVGNNELCGGIAKLDLPPCPSFKSSKNKLSHMTKMILLVVGLLLHISSTASCFKKEGLFHSINQTSFLRVSYAELLKATNGFSEANLIGVGNYASVFKGILDQVHMVVTVKVLNLQTRGASKSFMSECKALRAITHRNLLKILTICSSVDFHGNEFKALVYEFMANGNLGNWLHQVGVGDHEQLEERRNLKLIQRLDISTDIASALQYLRCGCESTIIHGDLKPSNVLLDDEMMAHIGDFGLAKIISTVSSDVAQLKSNSILTGTRFKQDSDSEPHNWGSRAAILPRKKRTDEMFKDHLNLHNFVKNALPDRVMEIVDPFILLEHNRRSWIKDYIVSILRIGIVCSMESPTNRMEMGSQVDQSMFNLLLIKVTSKVLNYHFVGDDSIELSHTCNIFLHHFQHHQHPPFPNSSNVHHNLLRLPPESLIRSSLMRGRVRHSS